MKKTIFLALLFIGLGFLLGEIIFTDKIELIKKLQKGDTYYFLEEGIYNDYDTIQNNLTNINRKIIQKKDNKYHVYLGITKDLEVLETLIKIYEDKNISVHPKEIILESKFLSANIDQFDLLIKETKDIDQILSIEEVVIANYEEITKNK